MFVIFFAIFATVMFRRKARQKGCDLKKPTFYPLIAALAMIAACFLILLVSNLVCELAHFSPKVQYVAGWVINIFCTAVYLTLVSRAWKSLSALPDRKA
ncbi:hypothetical protein KBB96_00885 [Luteolibacter ambystomatis]|uniref:Uncharacterized protein n=1 Tax=Luteolibacter ambystomatis TaxID=2824561 RepID=A0A975G9H2_9BACT|nr:hypothetical protein [Luteolibacter ambystomatis]QUE51468.1 hypothetical protein KBB96_00885 [Luteolibacter ambystomatis]